MSSDDKALRDHLLELLRGSSAHVDLATVVDDFPEKLRGTRPEKTPYSAWQLLEHMRMAVNDLLIFSTDPSYAAPNWPDDYWPAKEGAAARRVGELSKSAESRSCGLRGPGARSQGQPLREDSLGRWSDPVTGDHACLRPHQLSSGRDGPDQAAAWRMAKIGKRCRKTTSSSRPIASEDCADRSCAEPARILRAR